MKWEWKVGLKDIFWLVAIVALVFWGISVVSSLQDKVEAQNVEFAQLSKSLVRAQTELAEKGDLVDLAKQIGMDFARVEGDIKDIGGRLVAVGETVAVIEGKVGAKQGSDYTRPRDPNPQPNSGNHEQVLVATGTAQCPSGCDTFGYTRDVQGKYLHFGKMPYGSVEFDASQEDPWFVSTDKVAVRSATVLSERVADGTLIFHHEISLENLTQSELKGKLYKLDIVESKYLQVPKNTKEFFLWAPHLDLSIDNVLVFGSDGLDYRPGAVLGFSVMAYGRTLNDNDWRFLRVGLGINTHENPYLAVEPARYNLGQFVPLISDLWLGVDVIYDSDWGIGLSIGTGL